jgi:nitrogen fixation protein FixH
MKLPRNAWPLGIVTAFILFIGGTTALIVVACQHPSELVSANYYEDELRFQDHMDKIDRTRLAAASLAYDPSLARLTLMLPVAHAQSGLAGTIRFFRPSSSGLDKTVELSPDARGIQNVDVGTLQPGLWKVKVSWTADGVEYLLDEKIVIQRRDA